MNWTRNRFDVLFDIHANPNQSDDGDLRDGGACPCHVGLCHVDDANPCQEGQQDLSHHGPLEALGTPEFPGDLPFQEFQEVQVHQSHQSYQADQAFPEAQAHHPRRLYHLCHHDRPCR